MKLKGKHLQRRAGFASRNALGLLLSVGASATMIASTAYAQSVTADIVGTVKDASGSVIPGAEITVTNKGTNETRKVKSSGNGDFVISALQPGSYSITVVMSSFKKYEVPNITLAAGDKPRIDAALALGDVSETISVEATTPLLQSETSTMQSSVNQQTVQDLPLNGRNFVQLVQLVPGSNEGPPNGLTNGSKPDDKRQSAAVSVNGQSDVLNNNMIDGMDNNERLIGTLGVRPSVDAVSEIRVQSNVYSADTGRTPGAAVNIITKSGTNHFHGTAYEYFRNDIFNSYPFQFGAHNKKQRLRQNQFGGSVGGPILHDKLFFFGDYEGFRLVQDANPTTSIVPTAAQEANPTAVAPAGARIDPAGLAYFKMYPLENAGSGKFVGVSRTTQFSNVADVRGDYQLNTNNSIFARYSYNNVKTWAPGPLPNVAEAGVNFNPNSGGGYAPDVAHQAVLSYTHTFSQNLLMTLQAGYLRVNNQNFPTSYGNGNSVGPAINTAIGMPGINVSPATSGLARVGVSGGVVNLGGAGVFSPLTDFSNAFQYQGSVTYTHAAHTFKAGAQVIRRQATSAQSASGLPTYAFTSFSNLLQGTYSSVSRSLSLANPHYRGWETSAYLMDDWHASDKLTINLGIRYDIFTPKTEVKNQISNWDAVNNQIVVAGKPGVSASTNVTTAYGLVAPRIGFADTIRPGWVIRGGFGMSFYPSDITSNPSLKNAPFLNAYGPFATTDALTNPAYAQYKPYAYLSGGAPPITNVPASNPIGAVRGVAANYRPGETFQYNLATQKDFHGNVLTVAYVAVEGRHAPASGTDLNAPPPGNYASAAASNAARPQAAKYPQMTTLAWFFSEGVSHYNSLQISFERRLAKGLSFGTNYTWSRLLDNYVGLSSQGTEGYGYNLNKFGDRYEYGNSDLDLRNRGVATLNYTLPFAQNSHGFVKEVASGWQVNLLGSWAAGQPFTVTNANNRSGQATGVASSDRPNLVGKPMLDASKRGVSQFFNTAAYQAQTLGTLGSAPRNAQYGPHYRHVDLSFIKNFPIHEATRLEFRAEGFNITNTANFATPVATLGSTTFGQLTALSPAYQPRVIQFALKLVY